MDLRSFERRLSALELEMEKANEFKITILPSNGDRATRTKEEEKRHRTSEDAHKKLMLIYIDPARLPEQKIA